MTSSGSGDPPQEAEPSPRVQIPTPSSAATEIPRWRLWLAKRRRKKVLSTDDLERQAEASRNVLRKGYGWGLLLILALQIAFVDWVFWRIADLGKNWDVEPAVMHSWLGATVVEVIGVTYVIVRHLFPPDSGR